MIDKVRKLQYYCTVYFQETVRIFIYRMGFWQKQPKYIFDCERDLSLSLSLSRCFFIFKHKRMKRRIIPCKIMSPATSDPITRKITVADHMDQFFFGINRKNRRNHQSSSTSLEHVNLLQDTNDTTTNTTTNTTPIRNNHHVSIEDGAPIQYQPTDNNNKDPKDDTISYIVLIVLYTLQGIPMGLSASIPFLIQQKIRMAATTTAAAAALLGDAANTFATTTTTTAAAVAVVGSSSSAAMTAQRLSYNANAIFALCSWPFSLKLLWAPIVDSCFSKSFGRRKSWLVPVQAMAGLLMLYGSDFVERQLGLGRGHSIDETINVQGVTIFFFALYFLMATQDIAVDGWALTMLSKKNRGRGPVCNSIGQNIGYFISFVGFLALNDVESSEALWRPLFGLKSDPENGLISLGSFIRWMGIFMLVTTTVVALFKHEDKTVPFPRKAMDSYNDNNMELDAAEIGLKETYHRIWAVCKLPSVRWLFLILLTYRLPTSLGDNVKFLKAVEFGLSKSATAVSYCERRIHMPQCMCNRIPFPHPTIYC